MMEANLRCVESFPTKGPTNLKIKLSAGDGCCKRLEVNVQDLRESGVLIQELRSCDDGRHLLSSDLSGGAQLQVILVLLTENGKRMRVGCKPSAE